MKTDSFQVLTELTDQPMAERLCATLEDAGISIMLQHVQATAPSIEDGDPPKNGYRLFVPREYWQRAARLVHQTSRTIL